MKRLQLQRWSGTVLSPRTRPPRAFLQRRAFESSRRNAATATASAPSRTDNDPRFPPLHNDRSKYSHLPSPPPPAAKESARLAALHSRLNLSSKFPLETLARCLIHPSAEPNASFNNVSLALLGDSILGYHASELVLCQYPRLPTAVIFAAVSGYVGPAALTVLAKEWGVEVAAAPGGEVDPGLLQYQRLRPGNSEVVQGTGALVKNAETERKAAARYPWRGTLSRRTITDEYLGEIPGQLSALAEAEAADPEGGVAHETAAAQFVRAVVGAVYLHAGRAAAKLFFNAHVRSRKLDVSRLFTFKQPTRDLSRLCAREGFEPPVARILAETGRHSRTPVFTVGAFSGKDKLGEGTGASLDEARFRGAVAALKGWYLYSPMELRVPSDVEGGGKEWEPVLVDGGEVIV